MGRKGELLHSDLIDGHTSLDFVSKSDKCEEGISGGIESFN